MQLDRIVNFHKTIGDKTRIRIICLLKEGLFMVKQLRES